MPWAVCDALACTGLTSVWLLLEPTRSERRPDRRSELESDDITTTNGGVERWDASLQGIAGAGKGHRARYVGCPQSMKMIHGKRI